MPSAASESKPGCLAEEDGTVAAAEEDGTAAAEDTTAATCRGYHWSTWLIAALALIPSIVVIVIETTTNTPDGNGVFHHSVSHSAIAICVFFVVACVHSAMTARIGACAGPPLAGTFTAIAVYASREIRDYNKGSRPVFRGRTKVQSNGADLYDDSQWFLHIPIENWVTTNEFAKLGDCSSTCVCIYGPFQGFDTAGLMVPSIAVVVVLTSLLTTHALYMRRLVHAADIHE